MQLALVPGQGAWDASVNAWEDKRYGWSVAYAGAMVGEQILYVASFGQSQVWRTGATCAASTAARAAAPAFEAGDQIIARTAQEFASQGFEGLAPYMTRAEQAAYLANPRQGARFLGQAVHNATAQALEALYPGRFLYSRVGPDFVDRATG